jgi:fumarylacetoacetase
MLELTWRGAEPITLSDGTQRRFLEDGDTLIIKGYSEMNGVRIGFGEVRGTVIPQY